MAENIIRNGDFLDKKASWKFSQSEPYSVSDVIGQEERKVTSYYCKIAGTESVYQSVSIIPGKDYVLAFKARGGDRGKVSINLENSHTEYWSAEVEVTHSWELKKFEFNLPKDKHGPYVLHFHADPTASTDTDKKSFLEITEVYLSLK